VKLFTIGFTKKSAETFFARLKRVGVKRLVDVRLNNVSQLAGFAKKDDLRYFAKAICNIDYVHCTDLAPTQEMLDGYKKQKGDWEMYQRQFVELIRARRVEELTLGIVVDGACLLCSEEKPDCCHRRLVAEYLRDRWTGVEIEHIP
jgi:uncharacterized protein (DUF488 family)